MSIHIPVMMSQVMDIHAEHLSGRPDLLFVDATLGAGGHAYEVLRKYPDCRLIGFDQDLDARMLAAERLAEFGERVCVVSENFRMIEQSFSEHAWQKADGILFDLGVSNMQLTTPERGFSYQDEGPLDMRMDRGENVLSAEDIVNKSDIKELSRIFREYGEERYAFQIAKAIVRFRDKGGKLSTTNDLTALIRSALPAPVQRKMGTHPARRVFQALRIAVNAELDVLTEGLEGAYAVSGDEAVIIVISYHSLEDRIVKRCFLRWAEGERGKILTRRPLIPTDEEIEDNRSSRSAKLRAFIVKKP